MITLTSCPICDSFRIGKFDKIGSAPVVKHEIMPGVDIDAAIISRYYICQNCSVIFQNPRLSNSELKQFYRKGIYHRILNLSNEERDNDEMARAVLDSEIISGKVGNVESHLDIGCSRGFLLDKIGAKIKVGIELKTDLGSVSGIEVYADIKQVPQKSFALVTAIHTLEHVADPTGYLKDMVNLVDKGGYLVIEVPTWKSPGGPLRLPHLYHFEPDVLRMMCREVGLNVLETKFTPHLMLICKLS